MLLGEGLSEGEREGGREGGKEGGREEGGGEGGGKGGGEGEMRGRTPYIYKGEGYICYISDPLLVYLRKYLRFSTF